MRKSAPMAKASSTFFSTAHKGDIEIHTEFSISKAQLKRIFVSGIGG